jgi:hypothetical protein
MTVDSAACDHLAACPRFKLTYRKRSAQSQGLAEFALGQLLGSMESESAHSFT